MGGFNFNPVLSEIQSHMAAMSPSAQAAVKMANPSIPTPQETAAAGAPSVIPPGMLLPHPPEAAPLPGNISMPGVTPMLSSSPQPEVKAPRGTIEGDTNARGALLGEKPGWENLSQDVQNSRLGQAHPLVGKLLGGAAEVGGFLGNTLANAAPGIGREIPGTTVNHNMLLGQANTALTQDVGNAGKEAQAEEEEARANAIKNPQPKESGEWTVDNTFQGPNGEPVEINRATGEMRVAGSDQGSGIKRYVAPEKGAETKLQKTPGTVDGKQVFANYDPASGKFTDQEGKEIPNFQPANHALQGAYGGFGPAMLASRLLKAAYDENPALLPYLAPLLNRMLSEGGGAPPGMTDALGKVPTGQPQNDQGTPIGLRQPESPTGSTRSRGQFAEEVLPTMHDAAAEIDKIGGKLGPFMGRISELVTGKVGAYGPEFSALQTDLHNIATGWGRLHGNSVETMKQFYEDLDSSKDPANLKAKLERYEKQAETYKQGGAGRPGNEGGGNTQTFTDNGVTYNIPRDQVDEFKKDHPNAR